MSGKSASLVLTIIGPDRPGIVDAISHAVTSHGGNWEESRMARLASRFAGILAVSVDESRAAALTKALEALASHGLRVVVERDVPPAEEPVNSLVLELVGNDRPGIVREISHALAERGVNIEELDTECVPAAMSGQSLFKATARLNVPSSVSTADLRKLLERIGGDLMVDVQLDEPL